MDLRKLLWIIPCISLLIACEDTPDSNIKLDLSMIKEAPDYVDSRDGKVYPCIQIGNQIWMTKNLEYFPDGGLNDGCYTWNQKRYDMSLIQLDKDTFAEIWNATADDPSHDWKAEASFAGSSYKSWLTSYYLSGKYTQEAFLKMFSSSRYSNFMAAFNKRKLEYIQTSPSAFREQFLALTNTIDQENGEYSKRFGYLYSLAGARKATPEGWRIPTDEDWIKLELSLGMNKAEASILNGWRGSGVGSILKLSGSKGFGAMMGGADAFTSGTEFLYINKDESAYFWVDEEYTVENTITATGEEQGAQELVSEGKVRQLSLYSDKIWRGTTRIKNASRPVTYSVRLVRDAN